MGALTDTFTLSTGAEIPGVGFGTWQIPDGKDAYNAVRTALEVGYRHIDTAHGYGNEVSVGRAVRDSGVPREEIFLTSKLPADAKTHDDAVARMEQSLERLNLGYIDLYLIHAPWPWGRHQTRFDEGNLAAWDVLQDGLDDGRLRAIGVSNFDVHDLENILAHGDVVPAANQIQYYIGFTEPIITGFCHDHDILVEAYSPLATGDILDNSAIQEIADAHRVSLAQVALRFCLQNGVLPLPKATGPDHIRDNAALDFQLSDQEMALLDELPDAAPGHYHNPTQG